MNKNQTVSGFLNKYQSVDNYNVLAYGSFNGKFDIPQDKYSEFITIYSQSVVSGNTHCILEKPQEYSPIIVDVDIKIKISEYEEGSRLYDSSIIKSLVKLYVNEVKSQLNNEEYYSFNIYVLEKDQPSIKDKIVKDGFHMIITGYNFDTITRKMIHSNVCKSCDQLNLFDEKSNKIIDESVISRNCWLLYGSVKPDGHIYKVSKKYFYDESENLKLIKLNESDETYITKFSMHNTYKNIINNKKVIEDKLMNKYVEESNKYDLTHENIAELLEILNDERADEYELWNQVGLALHNTDVNLYDVFDEFSKRSDNYNAKNNRKIWNSYKQVENGLTIGSICYWASIDNPDKYIELKASWTKLTKEEKEAKTTYKNYKNEVEKNWFKLNNPITYCRNYKGELQMYSAKDAKEYFRNKKLYVYNKQTEKKSLVPFFNMWADDTNIKTFEKIVFDPLNQDTEAYNLFKGFENTSNEKAEDVKEFSDLVKAIFTDEISINYFYSWLSHILNTPETKTGVCIVLYSDKHGVGKNTLIELITKLLGESYVGKLNKIDDIEKQFNAHLTSKLLIYGDEIKPRASSLASELKNIITQSQVVCEKKFRDCLYLKDLSNYIFTTNDEIAFKVEKNDRRFFCVEIEQKQSKQFYESVYKAMEDETKIKKFFNFVKQYKGVKIVGEYPPATDYKQRLIGFSLDACTAFLFKNVKAYAGIKIQSSDLMDKIVEYAKHNRMSSTFSNIFMGKIMTELIDVSDDKIKRHRFTNGRGYSFPKMSDMLEILKKYSKDLYVQLGLEMYESGDENISDDESNDYNHLLY